MVDWMENWFYIFEKKGYLYCSLNDKSALKEVYKADEV